jgi:hypothetical protein
MTSKLKAIDPKKAEPSKPKILIFGKPGAGKTWSSLEFPNVYYIDAEGGANLEHYTDKLKKSGGVYFGPEQGALDFEEVIEQVKALATESHPYKTLVIDSLSKLFNTAVSKEMDRMEREKKEDAFGASRKKPVRSTRQLVNWINRLDMNVVLICHEKAVWLNEKQTGTTFDAWDKLDYELHLCLNIQKQGERRKAIVTKSRLVEFPDRESFDWSFQEFAKKYGEKILNDKVKSVELITDAQLAEINRLIELLQINEEKQQKWLDTDKADSLQELSGSYAQSIINAINEKISKKDVA